MIHYQLRCGAGHGFDGWFRDSATFDEQAKRGLLACPECGDAAVVRALMSPALPRKGRAKRTEGPEMDRTGAQVPPPPPVPGPVPDKAAVMPDTVRAVLQRLRAEVEKTCDHVGTDFAEEARRIHAGDSERRGIYGETTPEQADALADEGIEVSRLPWVPLADS